MIIKDLIIFSFLGLFFGQITLGRKAKEVIDWKLVKPKVCVNDEEYTQSTSPIIVTVILHITSVYDISEENMEFGLQVLLQEMWTDSSINITETQVGWHKTLPSFIDKCILKPDTIFHNAKKSRLYEGTLPNTYTGLTNLTGTLQALRKGRYMLTVSCSMKFHLYPMDKQFCSLEIGLLASTKSEIRLRWLSFVKKLKSFNGVYYENKIKPLNFDIIFLNTNITKWHFGTKELLVANVVFVRSLMASIVNTYVPSFLVVCLSFVSFWLDVAAVPGRVTLGVTAILTLATSITQARGSLPTLDYMTAMDVWLLGCMITVFLSLIEFTLAQAWSRHSPNLVRRTINTNISKIRRNNNRSLSKKGQMVNAWSDNCVKISYINKDIVNRRMKTKTSMVSNCCSCQCGKGKPTIVPNKRDNALDRASRIFFPLAFIGFTVIYWVHFMNLASELHY